MKQLTLNTPTSQVFMIGPVYAKRLQKLNIFTVNDFLHHYPFRYQDLRQNTLTGRIVRCQNIYTRTGKKLQKATIQTKTKTVNAIWFNQPFLTKSLKPNLNINLAGEQKPFNHQLTYFSPEYEIIKPNSKAIHTDRLVPIYPETAGLSSKWLRSRLNWLLNKLKLELQKDFLPQKIKAKYKLIKLSSALKTIHFPKSNIEIKSAQKRLAFDEMFLLQLEALVRKKAWQQKTLSHQLTINRQKILSLISNLPFKLTPAQNKCLKQILSDLKSKQPMNRLLQGDVGSGKTVLAAIAIYASYLNGFNSILMAPTEILANQHFKTLKTVFSNTNLKLKLITSSSKKNKKKADVLVGTHALLFRKIDQQNLGIVVIDEQHRFGVKQRSLLLKSQAKPHFLSMTATPIPRTIALTAYADLDLSILDELPPNRIPVKTWVVKTNKRPNAYRWLAKEIKKHHTQAFIVCPLIENSEAETMKDIKNVTDHFNQLKSTFPNLKLDLLHGKLKNKQKKQILERFSKNLTNILISTQVIEVGIDIPNATIMVIEDADRFGLAQLHQLRGRVGRGQLQSYCLLFTQSKSDKTLKRLKALEKLQSGFKLAELDLRLRGPGNIYGLKQHGFLDLKLANFSDPVLVNHCRLAALSIIDQLNPALKKILKDRKINHISPN